MDGGRKLFFWTVLSHSKNDQWRKSKYWTGLPSKKKIFTWTNFEKIPNSKQVQTFTLHSQLANTFH